MYSPPEVDSIFYLLKGECRSLSATFPFHRSRQLHCQDRVKPMYCGYIGAILGLYWGYIGATSGYIGVISGIYWVCIGDMLGIYWGYIWVILGSLANTLGWDLRFYLVLW